jgi:hypothetical protein
MSGSWGPLLKQRNFSFPSIKGEAVYESHFLVIFFFLPLIKKITFFPDLNVAYVKCGEFGNRGHKEDNKNQH